MENREDILKELQEVSMAVASIGNHNVYTVANGYFETLAGEIIEKLQTTSLPVSSVPYSMPAGYFNNLADSILNKIKAQETPVAISEVSEELAEIAPLLNTISGKNVYTVPAGYFEQFSVNVLPQEAPAAVSEVSQELAEIAPLLNTISRKNVYSTPPNYFQQFTVNINLAQTQPAKVVPLKRFRPGWVSYLAAACVAGALITGAFLFKGDNKPGATNSPANIEQGIASLSDDDINNYLNDHPAVNTEVTPSVLEQDMPDIQPAIENMSTDSIKQYLNENSEPGEKRVTDI